MPVSFRDVKAEVLGRMVRGDWPPGARLPGEEDLAREFACARTTVNRALRELADEGYLDRKRKSGTRVRAAPKRQARFSIPLTRHEVEAIGAAYRYKLIERKIAPVPPASRKPNGLRDPAINLISLHFADDQPFQLEDRWIDLSTLPAAETADFTLRGANEWLVETVPYSDVEISFAAISATQAQAAALGCPVGAPLFSVERATWFSGQPVTFVQLSYRPGHRVTTRY
ncbi:MAG: UTRA domain-containing protein [Pseudomonadota bacterium]